MRKIKLTFTDSKFVEELLSDNDFNEQAAYLKPKKLSDLSIVFFDPVDEHTFYDTETVVLSICARAIKRTHFKDIFGEMAFNFPYTNQLKGGINFNGMKIVDSTDVQISNT